MNKILVIGACGQIGLELIDTLRKLHGHDRIIATDVKVLSDTPFNLRPYVQLNVLDKVSLHSLIIREKVVEVYHVAAMLSATGEKQPLKAWDLNIQDLLNVLDVAKTDQLKVFWPSSIAVFGPDSPKAACPQNTITQPKTVYGISKVAGELWCRYYHDNYGVDVRSVRFPGLIGYNSLPGGGTTDYAVDIFYQALKHRQYTCYLKAGTTLPMMYMPDAIKAITELMNAPAAKLTVRTSYNLSGMSFNPHELGLEIQKHMPAFNMIYRPDTRQHIADSWPCSIDDRHARHDWGWKPRYDLPAMVTDVLKHLEQKLKV